MSNANDPAGTIPVEQAKEWTANWRNYIETSKQEYVVRSFNVPIINFVNILKYNPAAESVTAYLSLKSATDPTTAQLILVPIINGKEVPEIEIDGEVVSNTYDIAASCPPLCPVKPGSLE